MGYLKFHYRLVKQNGKYRLQELSTMRSNYWHTLISSNGLSLIQIYCENHGIDKNQVAHYNNIFKENKNE